MEEGDGLVERVAGFDVGEDDGIRFSAQRRVDALDAQALGRDAGLQVERSVHDAASELTLLGHLYDVEVAHGEGEVLLVHLLRAVVQCDARFLDAHLVAEVGNVAHLLDALFLCGVGDDRRVGEEQQLVVAGQRGGGDMCEHASSRQDSFLLVQHDVQQTVGIDEPLHEDVHLSLVHHLHGAVGGIVGIGGFYEEHVVLAAHDVFVLLHLGAAAHEDGVNESCFQRELHRLLRVMVGSPHHGHALPLTSLCEVIQHVFKTSNGFHSVCYFD